MNGRILIIALFLFALVLGVITYRYVPNIIVSIFMAKPGQTDDFFNTLEAALLRYHADHGAFPPTEPLAHYRRPTKNMTRTRVPGVSTYRLHLLTSPVAYINPGMPGDPYAVPEQFSPPGFMTGSVDGLEEWALLISPGPNLTFDTRPSEIRELTTSRELEDYLATRLYDPTNGLRGGGDYHRLIVPPVPVED